ncbi:hypothetical protein WN55_07560 [Dufourea novaeangliae]|uniref:Uncharacterized protein n=1 Tax=Dufourea novaeangliae TaxID=178035 RepID=A0A154PSI6_DUFNO|nr:hypothetical protein WN55_07560 [Dufourea novaeangliae]
MIHTQGEVCIPIQNIPVYFQIVNNDFPIQEAGILGISFLQKQEATLQFKNNLSGFLQFGKGKSFNYNLSSYDLPPRTKALITVPTTNINPSGYVRRINTGPGIFVGEVLASQQNGSVKIYAINTTLDHIILTIPAIELEEFDIMPPASRSSRTGNPDVPQPRDHALRLARLI